MAAVPALAPLAVEVAWLAVLAAADPSLARAWGRFFAAQRWSLAVGKPLLTIGLRGGWLEPPAGEVVVDEDPLVAQFVGGKVITLPGLPFPSKSFGAVLIRDNALAAMAPAQRARLWLEAARVANMVMMLPTNGMKVEKATIMTKAKTE